MQHFGNNWASRSFSQKSDLSGKEIFITKNNIYVHPINPSGYPINHYKCKKVSMRRLGNNRALRWSFRRLDLRG